MRLARDLAAMSLLLLTPALAVAQTGVANAVRFKTLDVSASEWPVASVSTEFAGYVTVLAVTPGVDGLAVQVLWPRTPADTGWVEAEQSRRLRTFSFNATSHRVANGGVDRRPIVIGLHSPKRPNLDAFIRGGDWAMDAVVKVKMDSTTEVLDVLGAVLFGENVRFAANVFRETVPVGQALPTAKGQPSNQSCNVAAPQRGCLGFLTPEDPQYRLQQSIEAQQQARIEAERRAAAAKKPPG